MKRKTAIKVIIATYFATLRTIYAQTYKIVLPPNDVTSIAWTKEIKRLVLQQEGRPDIEITLDEIWEALSPSESTTHTERK